MVGERPCFVQFPFNRGVGGGVRRVPLTLVTQGERLTFADGGDTHERAETRDRGRVVGVRSPQWGVGVGMVVNECATDMGPMTDARFIGVGGRDIHLRCRGRYCGRCRGGHHTHSNLPDPRPTQHLRIPHRHPNTGLCRGFCLGRGHNVQGMCQWWRSRPRRVLSVGKRCPSLLFAVDSVHSVEKHPLFVVPSFAEGEASLEMVGVVCRCRQVEGDHLGRGGRTPGRPCTGDVGSCVVSEEFAVGREENHLPFADPCSVRTGAVLVFVVLSDFSNTVFPFTGHTGDRRGEVLGQWSVGG